MAAVAGATGAAVVVVEGAAAVVVDGVGGSACGGVVAGVGGSACSMVVAAGWSNGDASRVMRSVVSETPPTEAAATVEQSTTFPIAVDTNALTLRRRDGRSNEPFNGRVLWLSMAASIICPVEDGSWSGAAAVA